MRGYWPAPMPILKGEKRGELPVQQSTKVEPFHKPQDRKATRLEVPTAILLRANEVIE